MATKTKTKAVAAKPQLQAKSQLKRAGTSASNSKGASKPVSRVSRPKSSTRGKTKAQRPDIDLGHFRSLLIEERKRLEDELEQVRSRHIDMDNALPEEGEGGDEDTADLASAMMDKEMDLSVEDEIEELLGQVDRAFQKLEEGTYGICDVSGRPIPVNRLEAIPYATLTVECQSLSEA